MQERRPYGVDGDYGTRGGDDDGQRPCARGERCAGATVVRQDDGTLLREPTLGYRTLCDRDRGFLERCLADFGGHYADLHARIGDKGTGAGEKVSGSRSAPIPLNVATAAFLDDMVRLASSWMERVADVALLHMVGDSRRLWHDASMRAMGASLALHVDVLLSLPPGPMTRYLSVPGAAEYQYSPDVPGGVYADAGWAWVILDLDGGDAAEEFIRANSGFRRRLGLVGKDVELPVACPACGHRGFMVRPDTGAGLADYAQCNHCGGQVQGTEYDALIADAAEREAVKARKVAS